MLNRYRIGIESVDFALKLFRFVLRFPKTNCSLKCRLGLYKEVVTVEGPVVRTRKTFTAIVLLRIVNVIYRKCIEQPILSEAPTILSLVSEQYVCKCAYVCIIECILLDRSHCL